MKRPCTRRNITRQKETLHKMKKQTNILYLRVICVTLHLAVHPTPVCRRIVIRWGWT